LNSLKQIRFVWKPIVFALCLLPALKAVGDTFGVTAGCDRRFATCQAKFDNAVNFRGFPHIPGSDYVLRHPRNGDALDGRAVVP